VDAIFLQECVNQPNMPGAKFVAIS
jgi:hypothetical protein